MEFKNFMSLILLFVFAIIPASIAWHKHFNFSQKWKYLFPALIFSGAIFIIWDIRFTALGIWNFNPSYFIGIELANLPIEEWLAFLIIPMSGIYIYEYLKIRLEQFEKPKVFLAISLVLLFAFALLAFFSREKLFTFFTFFLLSIYFAYTIFRNRFKKHYTKFYLAFFISSIPFLIVKSILISAPAISYNPAHILGIRLFLVPVENLAYLFLLLLMNTTIFEYLKERQFY